jgi:hypothetical protein
MFVRKLVEIDERWEKKDGIVYRLWRIVPETEWTWDSTPYNEIPIVVLPLESEAQP